MELEQRLLFLYNEKNVMLFDWCFERRTYVVFTQIVSIFSVASYLYIYLIMFETSMYCSFYRICIWFWNFNSIFLFNFYILKYFFVLQPFQITKLCINSQLATHLHRDDLLSVINHILSPITSSNGYPMGKFGLDSCPRNIQ